MPSRVNTDERTIPSAKRPRRHDPGVLPPVATGADAQIGTLTLIAPASPGGGWDQTARAMQQALQQSGGAEDRQGGQRRRRRRHGRSRAVRQRAERQGRRADGDRADHGRRRADQQVAGHAGAGHADREADRRVRGARSCRPPRRYRTLGEFIKAWKANPGLPIAGGSAGGTDHMLTGLLAAAAGVDVTPDELRPALRRRRDDRVAGRQSGAGRRQRPRRVHVAHRRRTSAGAGDLEREAAPGHRHSDLRRAGRQPDARQLARRRGAPGHQRPSSAPS